MAVILPPEEARKISEKLQSAISNMPTKKVSLLASVTISLSASFILFGYDIGNGNFVQVKDLIFKYHLILPSVFLLVNVVAFLCAAIKNIPDRFRFATLLVTINFIDFWLISLEVQSRFPDSGGVIDTRYAAFFIISFLSQISAILLCGIEAMRTEPRFALFKLTRIIGSWIQRKYDKSISKIETIKDKGRGFLIASAVFFLVGVGIFAVNRSNVYYSEQSISWPYTMSEVVESKITKAQRGKNIELVMSYQYAVNDKNYLGHRALYGFGPTPDHQTVEYLQQNYTVGSKARVYYDPKKPARSTLISGKCYNTQFNFPSIIIAMLIAVSFFTYGAINYFSAGKSK